MPKVIAPIFGLRASGTLAKTVTFTSWKGLNIAKSYAVPRNPNTPAQQAARGKFSTLSTIWNNNPILQRDRDPFEYRARAIHYRGSGYNLFLSKYMRHDDTTWGFVYDCRFWMHTLVMPNIQLRCTFNCTLPDTTLNIGWRSNSETCFLVDTVTTDSLGAGTYTADYTIEGDSLPEGMSYGILWLDDTHYVETGIYENMLY